MESKKGMIKQVNKIFGKLKTDVNSEIFTEKKINNRLLKKLEKLSCLEDKKLVDLISMAENFDSINKNDLKTLPIRLDYVEKREIDRSTLYSVDGPFKLVDADIADLRFLDKSATHPKYCLVAVDIYSSKVFAYPMRSRDLLTKKLQLFYQDCQSKRNPKKQNETAS